MSDTNSKNQKNIDVIESSDQFGYIEDQDLTAAVIDYSDFVEKFGSPEKQ
jgi:hypothetical protein